MDSNILLGIVIVAACIAAFFYLRKHKADLIAKVESAAAGMQSHVSGVVTNAQNDLTRTIATAVIPQRTLSPGVATPSATAATAPNPPALTPAAADAGNVTSAPAAKADAPAQTAAGSTPAAPAVSSPPAATATAQGAPALSDLALAPVTRDNMLAYMAARAYPTYERENAISYAMNGNYATCGAGLTAYTAAITGRAQSMGGSTKLPAGGDAFTSGGVTYSAQAIMAKLNALDEYQKAAALTDAIVATAVMFAMGDTPEWQGFVNSHMAEGSATFWMGPNGFNGKTGEMRYYDETSTPHDIKLDPFY